MVCVHLRALYDLCQTHQLKLGGSDLIRIVCTQCQQHDVCPSTIHEDGEVMPPPEPVVVPPRVDHVDDS
jgi:hypothetical protein